MSHAGGMGEFNCSGNFAQVRARFGVAPGPGVAEPNGWEQAEGGRLGAAVHDRDLDEDVFDIGFRVFDENVEISVFVEYSGVEQLVFWIVSAAAAIFFQQLGIRKCSLRIFVQILHVGMRGSAVEVEVTFFYVLAVIAFFSGEAEESLFEDGIALIPQRDGEANQLAAIADSGEAIFIPAVGSRAGVIVGEIFPGVAVGAVVFADSAPGALAEVGSPALPVAFAVAFFGEPDLLVGHRGRCWRVFELVSERVQSLFSPSRAATLYASASVG